MNFMDTTTQETVTVSKAQYDSLVHDSEVLEALRRWGVDNWPGYGEAMSELSNDE